VSLFAARTVASSETVLVVRKHAIANNNATDRRIRRRDMICSGVHFAVIWIFWCGTAGVREESDERFQARTEACA
jgi:hypothetical protein